ncbi:DUF2442 domain-containing protein [Larkinella sp. GY13]|jgi:hypothetical protein|uniref:DUF2442 domain-containing protein n=1 Tax=Larkinella sp. GY13 TaxID=3453720 RepID=UPI003EEAA5E7
MNNDDLLVKRVWFDKERIFVELSDGRIVGSPLEWFPRLQRATIEQRNQYELVSGGYGIHWEQLDEDLLATGFLMYSKKLAKVNG